MKSSSEKPPWLIHPSNNTLKKRIFIFSTMLIVISILLMATQASADYVICHYNSPGNFVAIEIKSREQSMAHEDHPKDFIPAPGLSCEESLITPSATPINPPEPPPSPTYTISRTSLIPTTSSSTDNPIGDTSTVTLTPTDTITPTPTATPTQTATKTPSPTSTTTLTPTPTQTESPLKFIEDVSTPFAYIILFVFCIILPVLSILLKFMNRVKSWNIRRKAVPGNKR
jgi:hypothetical protein